jgi:sugar phosphate isomerase/epimerase
LLSIAIQEVFMQRPLLGSTTVCYPLSVSPQFTLERALQGIAAAGLRYAEIVAIPNYCPHLTLESKDDREIHMTQQLLQKHGLTLSVLNVATDLTTPQGVERLGEGMRVARALGATTVVTHIDKTDTEEGKARFIALVPRIDDLADQHNVVVAIETHGGRIKTGTQGIAFLKELGSKRLRLTYDNANVIYRAGVRPEDDLTAMGPDAGRYIAHVHLKDKANMKMGDYNFPPFGTGLIDFRKVLELIDRAGYHGHMTLEVELDGRPETPELVDRALTDSYRYLEQFWTA